MIGNSLVRIRRGYIRICRLINLSTGPAIHVRRHPAAVWIVPTFYCRVGSEAGHHSVKPGPRHRRHHNQQGREHQPQAQLLGNGLHNAAEVATAEDGGDSGYRVGYGDVADQIHGNIRHHAEHDAGTDGGQPVV